MKRDNLTKNFFILVLMFIVSSFASCSDDTDDTGNVGTVKLTRVWNADNSTVSVEGYVVNPGSDFSLSLEYGMDRSKLDKKALLQTSLKGDTLFVYTSVVGLQKSSTYYIRLAIEKTLLAETFYSDIVEFSTTEKITPVMNSVKCSQIGINDFSLDIKVVPNGTGKCKVLLGENNENFTEISAENGGIKDISGSKEQTIKMKILNLEKGKDYYCKVVSTNEYGSRESDQMIIRTNYETVKDVDGKTYLATRIGNQLWLTTNWACDKYNDGTPMDSCFVYADKEANLASKGRLYTYDVLKAGNIAPEGWRVPTEADWMTLINYLGGEDEAGNMMKVESFLGQDEVVENVNRYNFTAVPAGMRNVVGEYFHGDTSNTASYAYYWSSTETNAGEAFRVYISKLYRGCYPGSSTTRNAYSVRLVKDID